MDSSVWEFVKWGWTALIAHNWHLHRKADALQKEQNEFIRRKEFDDTNMALRNRIEHNQKELTDRFDANRREMTERFDRLFSHLLEKK